MTSDPPHSLTSPARTSAAHAGRAWQTFLVLGTSSSLPNAATLISISPRILQANRPHRPCVRSR